MFQFEPLKCSLPAGGRIRFRRTNRNRSFRAARLGRASSRPNRVSGQTRPPAVCHQNSWSCCKICGATLWPALRLHDRPVPLESIPPVEFSSRACPGLLSTTHGINAKASVGSTKIILPRWLVAPRQMQTLRSKLRCLEGPTHSLLRA